MYIQIDEAAGTGEVTRYAVANKAGRIQNVLVAASADPGSDTVVTVSKGATDIGTATVADGETKSSAYVPDSTNGNTDFAEGDLITITIGASTGSVAKAVVVDFDEYGLKQV